MKYKLQDIIFAVDDNMKTNWGIYTLQNMPVYEVGQDRYILSAGKTYDFSSYLNAVSYGKWREYAGIDNISVELTISGAFQINLEGCYIQGTGRGFLNGAIYDFKEPTTITLSFGNTEADLVGISILAQTNCFFYGGSFFTEISEDKLRDVELSIATVTFKKENFITSNLALLNREIFNKNDEMSKHIKVHVIDNGRTLNVDELQTDRITIHPNDNVGGSGGYSRGMIEALNDEVKPTNILLMDDDIIVLPESIRRLYTLLRILKPEYQNHFISGAMLFYEERNVQHEDVGHILADGSYGPMKKRKYLHDWRDVVSNEAVIPYEKYEYAGWWFCCIPTTIARLDNLPLPLFIRGDDVEYSIRNNAKFITMNGICVWHMGFVQKFNAAMELYQVHRNSFMIQAISGVAPEISFTNRVKKLFRAELLRFNYDSAELLLDAVEDYMKGYTFLLEPNGEKIMKEKAAKNEKLIPLSEFPHLVKEPEKVYEKGRRNFVEKVIFKLTYNGHRLPKCLLKKEITPIAYDWFYDPKKYLLRRKLVAVNPHALTGQIREINKKRYHELRKRCKKLMKYYEQNNARITEDYRNQKEYLTSYEFWKKYLKLE